MLTEKNMETKSVVDKVGSLHALNRGAQRHSKSVMRKPSVDKNIDNPLKESLVFSPQRGPCRTPLLSILSGICVTDSSVKRSPSSPRFSSASADAPHILPREVCERIDYDRGFDGSIRRGPRSVADVAANRSRTGQHHLGR